MGNTNNWENSFSNLSSKPYEDLSSLIQEEILGQKIGEEISKELTQSLINLPPRVIVFDILVYFVLNITDNFLKKCRSEFTLFGYFKKDRFRTPFFLFTSINLSYKPFDKLVIPVLVNVRQIQNIIISKKSSLFLSLLKKRKFSILRKISIVTQSCINLSDLKEILQVQNCIKDFSYVRQNFSLTTRNIMNEKDLEFENVENLGKIKTLSLIKPREKVLNQFFEENNCKKIEKLYLSRVPEKGEEKASKTYKVEFPSNLVHNLREVSFFGENLLKENNFTSYPWNNIRNLFLHQTNLFGMHWGKMDKLRYLCISKCEKFSDYFFQNQSFYFLEKLVLYKSDNIKGEKWNNMPNLRTLFFGEQNSLNNDFFSENLFSKLEKVLLKYTDVSMCNWKSPNLRKLLLFGVAISHEFFENKFPHFKELLVSIFDREDFVEPEIIWEKVNHNLLNRLEALSIQSLKFDDKLFQCCEFKNLKTLTFVSEVLTGKDWIIQQLNKIYISGHEGLLHKEFFHSPIIHSTKTLQFSGVDIPVPPKGLYEFGNVERLILMSLEITNQFFRRLVFPNLIILTIHDCNKITGEKWNPRSFLNLEKLYLSYCEKITNTLFFENEFENAKVIKIKACENISEEKIKKDVTHENPDDCVIL